MLDGLIFDPQRRVVTHRGRSAELTGREADLFAFLLANPNRYFTASELVTNAWGASHLSAEELRVYVRRLRQKLAPLGLPLELTSQKWLGYCLTTYPEAMEVREPPPEETRSQAPASRRPSVLPSIPRAYRPAVRWGGLAGIIGVPLLFVDALLNAVTDHGGDAPLLLGGLVANPRHPLGLVGLLLMALGWVTMCYATWSAHPVDRRAGSHSKH